MSTTSSDATGVANRSAVDESKGKPEVEPGNRDIQPVIDENQDNHVNEEAVIQKASRTLGFIRYPRR
ncbi:hypothetical protein [Halorarum halobium]|uniref:hypothetical protein n=1 Tax=Halorarum halobium TaxID=3075121 RepID=UPI0028AD8F16|nr:hypothetical protein [Halobaculum sp. XH14]